MTSWTVLLGSLAIFVTACMGCWGAWQHSKLRRRVTELERVLRLTPVPSSRLKDPEPGSYSLSDAEAAQVEREQMVESQQRAQSRKARGFAGSSGSWRKGPR